MNSKLAKYVKVKFTRIAQDLMENPQGLKYKLEKAADKISKKSVIDAFGIYLNELKAVIRMSKAWASRKYTKVNTQTILYMIVGVVYFATPTDFVPDFILGLGFVDDLAVFTWVLSIIKTDLEDFKKWENEKANNKERKAKKK